MLNLLLLILSVWLLSAFTLALHFYSPRMGFALYLLALGAITVMVQSQIGVYIEPVPGFYLFLSSTMLVPIVLLGILVLYVASGTQSTRLTIYGIVMISTMVVILQGLYRVHLLLPNGGTFLPEGIPPFDVRNTIGSLLAFTADMFVIAIFYQGARNYAPKMPELIRLGLSLLAALWTDAIIFRFITDYGTPAFIELLPGDLLGKTIAAFILWLPAGIYLANIAPKMPGYTGKEKRPTLDLIFGSFEAVKLTLIRVEAALEKSEAERREQAAYFEQIANNIREALWLLEMNPPEITYFNPAYDQILGLNAEARRNPEVFLERVHPEDREKVRLGLERRFSVMQGLEYRLYYPDGKLRWIRERTFPICDESGVINRVAGISEDITERKEHEKQELELRLHRERVKLLQDFISETSHDLKSPLTAINLKLYRLTKSDDLAQRERMGQEIVQQTQRMTRMIDDLMTLARLENEVELKHAPVNLNDLIQMVYNNLLTVAQEKQQLVTLELDDNVPMIDGDADDLTRAINNLLDNAILYTPEAGQISLRTQVMNHEILFRIKDTGMGIPQDKQSDIFNRFFRADNARQTQPAGTGLGLAIVKKIVEQHEGTIDCVSALGTGTMFTIHLPIHKKNPT